MSKAYSFTCHCCGKTYDEIPLCFGNDFPDYYFSVPPEERDKRIELKESLCIIDDHYFHRGRLIIPITDNPEDLIFNVWTSISKDNFELRNEIWNAEDRTKYGPYFGWLQTIVPTYGDTLNIKTTAYENEVGLIPTIKVFEDLHPLKTDQENGITFQVALEKVQAMLADLHKK
jgi:hypothetical protein